MWKIRESKVNSLLDLNRVLKQFKYKPETRNQHSQQKYSTIFNLAQNSPVTVLDCKKSVRRRGLTTNIIGYACMFFVCCLFVSVFVC